MDFERIMETCAVVGIDAFFLTLFYKLYKEKSMCLKNLKEAQHFEMNSELKKQLEDNGGTIPYAVITGQVKALSTPLRSEHSSAIRGVMQEKITNEYKVRWIPSLRIWGPIDNNINRKVASVPFSLIGKAGFFQKKVSVEIGNPFLAKELILSEVFNDYKRYEESLGESIIGFLSREHTVGIEVLEKMLLEKTTLTAIGKLTLENDNLKMAPPDNDLIYFLTPLTYDSLYKKISNLTKLYKGLTITMCVLTTVLLGYILKRSVSEIRRRINHLRDLKRCKEAKSKRNINYSRAVQEENNVPKCVVCLENAVEVVVLDCAHACLCFDCSERINSLCPICRTPYQRKLPVFMP